MLQVQVEIHPKHGKCGKKHGKCVQADKKLPRSLNSAKANHDTFGT